MTSVDHISLWVVLKNVSYFGALLIGLSQESYFVLVVFMIIDTILGISRVGIVHGGQAIKSYRMVSGIMAKLSILLIPLLVAYLGKGIGMDLHLLATWALNLLIISHFYSILGNINSIYLRRDAYEFDAISWALTRIQLVIERLLKAGAQDKTIDVPDTNRDLATVKDHG